MKHVLFLLGICLVPFTCCVAQTNDYQAFRERVLSDYQGFRKSVLDDYAKYLEGVWNEFQVFRGVKRDETPKPIVVPKVDEQPVVPVPQVLPEPEIEPEMPIDIPTAKPKEPILPAKPIVAPTLEFSFYGMRISAVEMKTQSVALKEKAIANAWNNYQKNGCSDVITSLKNQARVLGLNDWFTVELVRAYVDWLLKVGTDVDRLVLQHFLLANMGFDVRLAKTDNQLMLLIPFKQKMYERSYLSIDGIDYYVFYDNLSPVNETSSHIYSCEIPKDVNKGKVVDLMFSLYTLNTNYGKDRQRTLTDGNLHVTCTVNDGLMEMLRHYPPMDVPYYAMSKVIPPVHQDILNQLKPQIAGMNQKTAANTLLHFVQYAFDYATDGEQHGYEKTYFLEENFYYPKNDCEDRAIFYAFLVRNLLGLDIHLVEYPGHECTAVHFTDKSIVGDGYTYQGKNYLICDPTYIGAPIGMCMPSFVTETPQIELWY